MSLKECSMLLKPPRTFYNIEDHKVLVKMGSTEDLVLVHGGCHCGKVRYQVSTAPVVDVYNCKYVLEILTEFYNFNQSLYCCIGHFAMDIARPHKPLRKPTGI